MKTEHEDHPRSIAIIGAACRFPGANNLDTYWHNLQDGVFSVSLFTDGELIAAGIDPQNLNNPNYVKANGTIENAGMFDAGFFGFNAHDASMMDPQQRVFLECAWEAIENAGYNAEDMRGIVGVYAGAGMNTYLIRNLVPRLGALEALEQFRLMIASDKDYIATRLSFKLNFTGPSVNVQTSCSTSLVAAHLACQSLLNNECDFAVVGGVSIRPPLVTGYTFREGMIYSPDGRCRAFDSRAGGTINSNGVGVIVVKRLARAVNDGDFIHAVIKSTAINNDGSAKRSYSAPSSEGQAEVIAKAIERAGIRADQISYVEAHGTGTIVGDPIEIDGLARAFRRTTDKKDYCAIGSAKTNIGHTDVAAGMAGLLKVVQMLKHRVIPPSLHFETPNPRIDFPQTPFFVNTVRRTWETEHLPRRAGVSSFGVGGTNAHIILEEAPPRPASGTSRDCQLLVVSALSETALGNAIANLETHLGTHPPFHLADMCFTLQTGRKMFEHRASAVLRAAADSPLQWTRSKRQAEGVVFMFSGQGAQYVNMARDLYKTESVFRDNFDTCAVYLKPILHCDLRDLVYPAPEQETSAASQLAQTAITQTALFSLEYSLSQLWMAWGIQPRALAGHSIGEYVAACLAGVMTLEDALKVVAERGRLMQIQPPGSMLAIPLPEAEIKELLEEYKQSFEISLINSANACVVSGAVDDIQQLEQDLRARNMEVRILQTSHAFHSFLMDGAVQPFVDFLKSIPLKPPKIPYLSNVSGTWITSEQATDPAYYGRHIRQTVRFADNIDELAAMSGLVLLEVGPGQTLASLSRRHPGMSGRQIFSSTRHPNDKRPDQEFILASLGQLWSAGIAIDWNGFYQNETRRRVPMPTYPFERKRYWIDEIAGQPMPSEKIDSLVAKTTDASSSDVSQPPRQDDASLEALVLGAWRNVLGVPSIGIQDNFFDLGGDSLAAARLLAQIDRITGIRIPLVQFFQSPNPSSLVTLLRAQGWKRRESQPAPSDSATGRTRQLSMIKIIDGAPNRTPFFWTHGTDFANFSRMMDREQPFYVMPPPGLDGEHPVLTAAEDIIAYHIEQMKMVQPQGPYIIAGYCLGGHLALNIAQEIFRRGEQVAMVVLVDVTAPDFGKIANQKHRNYAERFIYHLRYGELPSRVMWKVKEYLDRSKTRLFGTEELRLLQQLDDIQQKAFEFRIPQGYPGRVVAFSCSVYDSRKPADSDARWARLAPNGVEHYVIPGDHTTLMREPNIDRLMDILNKLLRDMAGHDEKTQIDEAVTA